MMGLGKDNGFWRVRRRGGDFGRGGCNVIYVKLIKWNADVFMPFFKFKVFMSAPHFAD
jgi:hypothetical protein